MLELQVLAATHKGESPGAISSVLKTLGSEVKQQITELAAEAVAWYGLPFQPEALNPYADYSPIGPAVVSNPALGTIMESPCTEPLCLRHSEQ